jgi:hypothetical protein
MPPARQVGHERTSSRAVWPMRKRVSGWPLRNSLAAPYRECGGGHAAFSDRCAGAGRRGQRRRRNERRRLQGLCRSRSGRGAARDRAASLIDVHITLTSSMPIIPRRPQISEPAPCQTLCQTRSMSRGAHSIDTPARLSRLLGTASTYPRPFGFDDPTTGPRTPCRQRRG